MPCSYTGNELLSFRIQGVDGALIRLRLNALDFSHQPWKNILNEAGRRNSHVLWTSEHIIVRNSDDSWSLKVVLFKEVSLIGNVEPPTHDVLRSPPTTIHGTSEVLPVRRDPSSNLGSDIGYHFNQPLEANTMTVF
jgi:hypothetical protein